MIKPSDLVSLASTASPHLAAIEEHIDTAIRRHAATRHRWPLVVPSTRSGWSTADIDTVLARYRAAGWSALGGGLDSMCVLAPDLGTAIAQPEPAPASATMTVGTGDAKGMPPGITEELASMAPEDRAVAERVADMPEIEPADGYEDRAVDRARREDVI